MSSPGILAQDAATLLAQASGQMQGMVVRKRVSRASVKEALGWAEQAVAIMKKLSAVPAKQKESSGMHDGHLVASMVNSAFGPTE